MSRDKKKRSIYKNVIINEFFCEENIEKRACLQQNRFVRDRLLLCQKGA